MEKAAAVFVDGKTAAAEEAEENEHPYDCCTTALTPTSSANAYVNRHLADGMAKKARYKNGKPTKVRSFKVSIDNECLIAATEILEGAETTV